MSKNRVLYITQEMDPYLDQDGIGSLIQKLPAFAQDSGMEIRILMPRFGTINERRHRLHEVVRLSGMNIIIDDDDYALIIKVASLPGSRIQVYFLDNDEFFKRKFVFEDESGQPFEDNQDRMIFFCKGAIETVKKFGWAPDVVHCHGWMTSLIPFYLKTVYKNDPVFKQSKVVFSLYEKSLESNFNDEFFKKAAINNLKADQLSPFKNGTGITLQKGAIQFADGIIQGTQEISENLRLAVESLNKPFIETPAENYLPDYIDFYKTILS
ncbi:MAG: glycogen/starch synthase [Saprospiraceae bacterium]|jgi:starch synthase|nr:glycogen/starch synthase [Candidatus Vicinibacter proximus]MBL7822387.1 glycogen/starch synthase [Saprospiraceae bacterium]MCC6843139.1 glycogen/starch synthase [Saprospiraceae bacterium]HRG32037.1 glycogen/starch synthase [Saprospiraceae bacterium]